VPQREGTQRRSHGRQSEAAGRDRPCPQEGPGGCRRLRQHLEQGLRHRECEPEGEVRGGPQEGDQEVAAVPGPDQDVDPIQRDQGQEGSDGCPEAD